MTTNKALALDEAMAERETRHEIFSRFQREHLFDANMSDADFVNGLWERHVDLVVASERLLTLLGENV